MSTKKGGTGLAAFAVVPAATQAAAKSKLDDTAPVGERQRGKGATVALSLRVSRDQWQRLHELALHEGCSLNALALSALSKVFQDRGLKPL